MDDRYGHDIYASYRSEGRGLSCLANSLIGIKSERSKYQALGKRYRINRFTVLCPTKARQTKQLGSKADQCLWDLIKQTESI